MQRCFQSKYLGSNSAEGLHFSAFHFCCFPSPFLAFKCLHTHTLTLPLTPHHLTSLPSLHHFSLLTPHNITPHSPSLLTPHSSSHHSSLPSLLTPHHSSPLSTPPSSPHTSHFSCPSHLTPHPLTPHPSPHHSSLPSSFTPHH